MGLSKYYGSATADGSGIINHTISNPDNSNFAWLHGSHLEIRLSSAGQSLSSFQTAVDGGGVAKLTQYTNYSLTGSVLQIPSLTNNAAYKFEVRRITPKKTHFVDFQAGSPLTENDLDNSNKYALFRSQELEDRLNDVASSSGYTLTLAEMKSVASVNGDFVGHTDTKNLSNKSFVANTNNTYDCGIRNWNNS